MTDVAALEKRVDELERRLQALEGKKTLADALYGKAVELVHKHNKVSVIWLQRKLLIDFERATELVGRLEAQGIVGPAVGIEPRKILVKG